MHFSIKFKLLIKFQLLTEHSQKASLWRKNTLEVSPIDNDGFQERTSKSELLSVCPIEKREYLHSDFSREIELQFLALSHSTTKLTVTLFYTIEKKRIR